MEENIVLQVEHLTKLFDGHNGKTFAAVEDVSFEVRAGECVGLVGESGSGKSTIAKVIARLIDVTEGKVILCGQDITHLKGRHAIPVYRKIQMVFQSPMDSFDPRKTLGYGIAESLRNSGMSSNEANKRVKELLELCELPAEFAKRYPHEVSGGQCQRAAIARALAIKPSLLICDEATSSLDVTVQAQVMKLLKKLNKEQNVSFLFISHDLALVQQFCSSILVLYNGRLVEKGSAEQVTIYPQATYTKHLLNSVFDIEDDLFRSK